MAPFKIDKNDEYGFVRTSAKVTVPSVYSNVKFAEVPADSVETSI